MHLVCRLSNVLIGHLSLPVPLVHWWYWLAPSPIKCWRCFDTNGRHLRVGYHEPIDSTPTQLQLFDAPTRFEVPIAASPRF